MIGPKRPTQTDAEYARELDQTLMAMQQLVRSEWWKRLSVQLEAELKGAYQRMAAADTGDKALKATAEYMTLSRVVNGPAQVMQQVSETLAAAPLK